MSPHPAALGNQMLFDKRATQTIITCTSSMTPISTNCLTKNDGDVACVWTKNGLQRQPSVAVRWQRSVFVVQNGNMAEVRLAGWFINCHTELTSQIQIVLRWRTFLALPSHFIVLFNELFNVTSTFLLLCALALWADYWIRAISPAVSIQSRFNMMKSNRQESH